MAAFSYQQQQHSFLLDQTVFFPNTATATAAAFHDQFHHDANYLQSPASSMSMVVDDQNNVESGNELLAKKRKDKQMSSLNHAQSKDTSSNRLKKPKKINDSNQKEKKKNNNNNNNKAKNGSCSSEEEGAVGYIHVRARRGQATDSHSLAERVRREKISERMKLLQAIVPGCDKVTGKALMLDEIINYVQSLQNQVEFLSMKLASVNPMLYDFGVDLDSFMLKPDENMSNMVPPIMPSVQSNGGVAPAANDNYHHLPHLLLQNNNSIHDHANSAPTTTNISSSAVLMFQQSQMPNILSSQQGNGQQMQLWDMQDEQRLKLSDSRFALTNNLTPFQ